jgi:hypothetical protein
VAVVVALTINDWEERGADDPAREKPRAVKPCGCEDPDNVIVNAACNATDIRYAIVW